MSGDYADLCCERDLINDIYSVDDPEDVFDCWGIPTIGNRRSSEKEAEKERGYYQEQDFKFSEGEDVLVRRVGKDQTDLTFDQVCTIKKITEKAVLFHISEDWNDEEYPYRGREFWEPKKVLYLKKGEKQVVYMKHWVHIILLGIDIPI